MLEGVLRFPDVVASSSLSSLEDAGKFKEKLVWGVGQEREKKSDFGAVLGSQKELLASWGRLWDAFWGKKINVEF